MKVKTFNIKKPVDMFEGHSSSLRIFKCFVLNLRTYPSNKMEFSVITLFKL